MLCHCRTHQRRGKPIGLKTVLSHFRSDAQEDARIVTEKALESQEKDIVPEFSSMAIFDNIALAVHSNPSPPNTRIHPEK